MTTQAERKKVLFSWSSGTDAESTSKTYAIQLMVGRYTGLASALGLTEHADNALPEGAEKLSDISTAIKGGHLWPLKTQATSGNKTKSVTIYVPSGKIEDFIKNGSGKKIEGGFVTGKMQPKKTRRASF